MSAILPRKIPRRFQLLPLPLLQFHRQYALSFFCGEVYCAVPVWLLFGPHMLYCHHRRNPHPHLQPEVLPPQMTYPVLLSLKSVPVSLFLIPAKHYLHLYLLHLYLLPLYLLHLYWHLPYLCLLHSYLPYLQPFHF